MGVFENEDTQDIREESSILNEKCFMKLVYDSVYRWLILFDFDEAVLAKAKPFVVNLIKQ